MAKHNEVGRLGEDLAAGWMESRGFMIVERNHRQKWGEIDIVARETDGKYHFVEVKTVSYETKSLLEWAVTHETWRPEDNLHTQKQKRLRRVIETWLQHVPRETDWQFDLLALRIVPNEQHCRIEYLPNIILGSW
jgi:putative endonuclease